jgi:hypothetical protein
MIDTPHDFLVRLLFCLPRTCLCTVVNAHPDWEGTHLSSLALRSSIRGATCRFDAASLALAHLNFFHFIPSTSCVHTLKKTIIPAFNCVLLSDFIISPSYTTTIPTMPPRYNKQSPQPKHNRSNPPLHVNDGLAAKQRGENPADSWKFAKNMTIKDPSQIISTIARATNTYISYDNKFEFRFWGSHDNVCCSLSVCNKTC